MTRRASVLALLVAVACSGPERVVPEPLPDRLDDTTRAAYLSEDAPALRAALPGRLLPPGYRRALELSRLLQDGDCRLHELAELVTEQPVWVGFVEYGDCLAGVGRERDALEQFVHAVDTADTADEVHYVVRRVCRAADTSGLRTLAIMCTGAVDESP